MTAREAIKSMIIALKEVDRVFGSIEAYASTLGRCKQQLESDHQTRHKIGF